MILHLIKKDFLLAKRYILIIAGIVFAVPLIITGSSAQLVGASAFIMTVVYAEFIFNQQISMTELRYSGANALLCAAPYSRKNIVTAKYIFSLIIFAACCLVYSSVALIVPQLIDFSLGSVLAALLSVTILYGIYTPVQFKFGIEKTRFIFIVFLSGAAASTQAITQAAAKINLTFLEKVPEAVLALSLLITSAIIWTVSLKISIKIFEAKEI